MQNRNPLTRRLLAILIPITLLSGAASAGTLEEINKLNDEIAVLTLKAQKAELIAKIGKSEPSRPALPALPPMQAMSGMMPPPGLPGSQMSMPMPGAMPGESARATVLAIEGLDGRVSATLRHPGGGLEQVALGGITAEGWAVAEIGQDRVVLRKGKAARTLFLESAASN